MTADPLVLVEVASPSTQHMDLNQKLRGYFALESLRHHLIFFPTTRTITHFERRADGVIETHLCGAGPVRLDPPGLALDGVFDAMDACVSARASPAAAESTERGHSGGAALP